VATGFDQLYGHPQVIGAHKTNAFDNRTRSHSDTQ